MMLEDSVDYIRCNIIHMISTSEIVQQLKIIEKIHTIFIHIFTLFCSCMLFVRTFFHYFQILNTLHVVGLTYYILFMIKPI